MSNRKGSMQVRDLAHLKRICGANGGWADFYITLNGGLISTKVIAYEEGVGWTIHNNIDGSRQRFRTDRAMLGSTNIGEALEKGAFYLY